MRLHRLFLLLCFALSACSNTVSVQPEISPEEVLRLATRAVKTLESAQYTVQGDFDTTSDALTAVGTVRLDGMLADSGEQLRFQMDLTADVDSLSGDSSVSGTLEVVVISEDEVYMNVHSLISQPSTAFFRPEMIGALAGQWWLLSEDQSPPMADSITPDPRLLQAQAQVVTVTRDRGIEVVNGKDAYHYDTVLDKSKLAEYLAAVAQEKGQQFDSAKTLAAIEEIEASGQLWIDKETYYVQKINWVVQSMPLENGGTASIAFTVMFRNHNDTPAILPPQGAKKFSPAIFYTLPSDALFQDEMRNQYDSGLDDDALLEILQQINSQ